MRPLRRRDRQWVHAGVMLNISQKACLTSQHGRIGIIMQQESIMRSGICWGRVHFQRCALPGSIVTRLERTIVAASGAPATSPGSYDLFV
jgi:hypothetical protein